MLNSENIRKATRVVLVNAFVYGFAAASFNLVSSFDSSLPSVYFGVVAKFLYFPSLSYPYLRWMRLTGQCSQLRKNDCEKEPLLPQIMQVCYVAIAEAIVMWAWSHSDRLISNDTENDISFTQHLYFVPKSFVFEVAFDFFHYWAHRACHRNKFLYKWVHAEHHDHENPGVLTTFKMSIPEYILANATPQLLAFLVAGVRWTRFELHLLFTYKTLVEVAGHSGFYRKKNTASIFFVQFPFLPDLCLGLTAGDHDLHHSRYTVNYSKRFRLWDEVFGTYQSPETFAKNRLNRFVNLQLSLFRIRRDCKLSDQEPVKPDKLPPRRHTVLISMHTSNSTLKLKRRVSLGAGAA